MTQTRIILRVSEDHFVTGNARPFYNYMNIYSISRADFKRHFTIYQPFIVIYGNMAFLKTHPRGSIPSGGKKREHL